MTTAFMEPGVEHDRQALEPADPLRVILATINRAQGDTGVHTHTRMLVAGLRQAGATCDVISPFSGSRKWIPIFAVRPLVLNRINKTWATLWHRRWHMAAVRQNLQQRLAEGADVIVAQCPLSARAAIDARENLRLKTPVAMVCHFNGSEASEYRDKGELHGSRNYQRMLDFEADVLQSVDRVIYVSNWAQENVEAVRGIKARSRAVIWNGLSDRSGGDESESISRRDIRLKDDDLVLMNVGSIEPRKNQLGLIELFAAVCDEVPGAKLVLVGDGPARGEVAARVAELKLEDSVRFLGHRRDVAALLSLADLYVHYALLENCPLVLLEAARAGLAIAAAPLGGVPELLEAIEGSIELHPADIRGTIARLRPLLEDAAIRRAAGVRSRQAYLKTFTAEAMTQAYLRALEF